MKYCEKPILTELGRQLSDVVADTYVNINFELYTTKPAASDKRLIRVLDQQINDSMPTTENTFAGSYIDPPQLLSPPVSHSDKLRRKTSFTSANAGPLASGVSNQPAVPGISAFSPMSAAPTAPPLHNGGVMKRRTHSTPSSAYSGMSPFGPLAEVGNIKQYAYLIAALNASDPDRDFSALQPSSFRRIYVDVSTCVGHTIDSLGLKPPANLWPVLEEEITPSECKVYSLELPQQFLEDDDSGISWSKMFFFFNKRRKRVLFISMNSRPASYQRESSSDSEPILGELD